LRPVKGSIDTAHQENKLIAAKYYAMKKEATSFYSRYPGQTWKNILSFGDMLCEYAAVQEVTWRRTGPQRECVRTKSVVLPSYHRLSEFTLTCQLLHLLLPAFVRLDGDIGINLKEAQDPWEELAMCLQIPEMTTIPYPLQVASQVEATEALDQVAILVHEKFS